MMQKSGILEPGRGFEMSTDSICFTAVKGKRIKNPRFTFAAMI